MSDTLQHGRHQFGQKIFIENIVNPSWAIRLGLGLARQGGIPGNSGVFRGCSRRCFGMFQACSGFFPGIFIFIFKYPFIWCKVILENKMSPHDCYSLQVIGSSENFWSLLLRLSHTPQKFSDPDLAPAAGYLNNLADENLLELIFIQSVTL